MNKFESWQKGAWRHHQYGNVFRKEVYPGWSRITIGANEEHISLMLGLASRWEGPLGILYVLVQASQGYKAARYQSPEPCGHKGLNFFASKFQEYFEKDSRHHIWFQDNSSDSQLIYDRHNLIYAYGNEREIIKHLENKGFKEGDPKIPCPHSHGTYKDFYAVQNEIMSYWDWREFPLVEEHDDP